jgi:regulatory protein
VRRDYTRKPPVPLDREKLEQLALHYAGRYATTRAKLIAYLARKLRERGWAEEGAGPDIETLGDRFAELRYVDDAAYAAMRAGSLARRGYGARRVEENLRAAGVGAAERLEVRQKAGEDRFAAAEAFARKRRIGPFAPEPADRPKQQKQFAAFLRAGHDADLARRFVRARPGEMVEE